MRPSAPLFYQTCELTCRKIDHRTCRGRCKSCYQGCALHQSAVSKRHTDVAAQVAPLTNLYRKKSSLTDLFLEYCHLNPGNAMNIRRASRMRSHERILRVSHCKIDMPYMNGVSCPHFVYICQEARAAVVSTWPKSNQRCEPVEN